uniref:Fibrinogen C-terminal domain-containing protein n=1 Tax=Amphimedon queenslandica TaxID=400682 RepID=A0A1X7T159_AMPQE
METDGGGWTVFQRRQDGSVDFYRSWTDYENGFGDLSGEFWLGLSKIHRLTSKGINTLQIKIGDFEGNSYYAQYSTFSIGDASTEYRLNVSGYNSTGTAGDSLLYHNRSSFGTKDNVNDEKNCPIHWNGGWWFSKQIHCFLSHLNGRYEHQPDTFPDWSGVIWNSWKSDYKLVDTISCNLTTTVEDGELKIVEQQFKY